MAQHGPAQHGMACHVMSGHSVGVCIHIGLLRDFESQVADGEITQPGPASHLVLWCIVLLQELYGAPQHMHQLHQAGSTGGGKAQLLNTWGLHGAETQYKTAATQHSTAAH